ncbi:MAG: DUF1640 domain-containing protein [Thermodesulfobacteriota bacterium]
MPQTLIFDTLAYAKKLREAGVPERQAEIHAEALAGFVDEQLATKKDILLLQRDIKDLELRLTEKIETIRADLLKWVAGMLVAQGAIVAALVKLL